MRHGHSSLMLVSVCSATVLFVAAFIPSQANGQTQNSVDCRVIAYLPPMATFGGPATVSPGSTELGLGFGAYGEILPSPCIHAGGEDWFARWRRGLNNRIDLGLDFQTTNQSDGSLGGGGKFAVRYQATSGLRLEGGIGVADGGDGGDVNGDIAAVIGTHNPDHNWNYYASLRLGAARGCIGCGRDLNHAPGALVPLGAIGATAGISDNARFVMEAGLGGIFARQYPAPAGYIHFSFGILFDVGKRRN